MIEHEVKVFTVAEATEVLRRCGVRISPDLLRAGLQQGAFPFGTYIQTEKSSRCYVYENQLEQWLKERSYEQ